jgi:LmbE family N-acetylglucosaminyl deacetylase
MRIFPALALIAAFASCGIASAAGDEPTVRELRRITSRDRVLVLAPHPDDESLAAAGLIQKAVAARAQVRVIFATNGEANPWAQRFVEHRVVVSARDRERWGARRQGEGLRALATLGVSARDVIFLNLPDQGTTRLLMDGDQKTLAAFRRAIAAWRPTVAAIPAPSDLHPDHSACFVFARLVLGPPRGGRFTELDYLVHTTKRPGEWGGVAIHLAPGEQAKKCEAILCHASQTALSRKSLVAFARSEERFISPASPREFDPEHPIRKASFRGGVLALEFRDRKTQSDFRHAVFRVVADRSDDAGGSDRWSFPLPAKPTRMAFAGPQSRRVEIDVKNGSADIHLPAARSSRPRQIFVKLDQRGFFLDKAGWREVPMSSRGD